MQNARRRLLRHFWEIVAKNEILNENNEEYAKSIMEITDVVRDGVIEKWLSYSKAENLTEYCIWRLKVIRNHLTTEEQFMLKFGLRE